MRWNQQALYFVTGVALAAMLIVGLRSAGIRGGEMEPYSAPTEGGPAEDIETTPVPASEPATTVAKANATPRTGEDAEGNAKETTMTRKAMFGAGCFWGVEATFRKMEGVTGTAVGYSGGKTENPTYRQVCTDRTGHAEVVLVEFDPKVVTYEKLLEVFWTCHNPTTLNRQGPDVGSQYRSAIFYFDDEQKEAAGKSKAALAESDRYGDREIVTEITKAGDFWRGEEYHQQYYEKRGQDAGCAIH